MSTIVNVGLGPKYEPCVEIKVKARKIMIAKVEMNYMPIISCG